MDIREKTKCLLDNMNYSLNTFDYRLTNTKDIIKGLDREYVPEHLLECYDSISNSDNKEIDIYEVVTDDKLSREYLSLNALAKLFSVKSIKEKFDINTLYSYAKRHSSLQRYYLLWERNKVLYDFSGELEEELLKQGDNLSELEDMPVEVFERLPHDFFFVSTEKYNFFSSSLMDRMKDGLSDNNKLNSLTVLGFFVCYGDDPDLGIKFLKIANVARLSEKSELIGFGITLNLSGGKTIKECIHNSFDDKDTYSEKDSSLGLSADILESEVFHMVKYVLQYILYLASENAEVSQDEVNKHAYRKPTQGFIKNREREVLEMCVGKEFSVRVRNFKQQRQSISEGTGTGSVKAPHVRRAHWHHFWTGSGDDKELVLRWVEPTYIHKDLMVFIQPTAVRV